MEKVKSATEAKGKSAGAGLHQAIRDATTAGEHALRIFTTANEKLNEHTQWMLEAFHRVNRKYFQAGLASLCSSAEAAGVPLLPARPTVPPPTRSTLVPLVGAGTPMSQLSPLSPQLRLKRPSALSKAVADLQDLIRSHVSTLDQLMDLSQALRRGQQQQLTTEEAEALFGPTPALFSLHTRLLAQFDRLMKTSGSRADKELAEEIVAHIAESLPAMGKDYTAFIRSESAALLAFSRLRNTPAYAAAAAHLPPQFDFLHIRTGALGHLREYEPLVAAIINAAGDGFANAKTAVDLLAGLRTLVRKGESAKAASERCVPLLRLKDRLFGFNDIAASDTRTLEFESPAVITSAPLAAQLLPPPHPSQSLAMATTRGRTALRQQQQQQKYHFYLFSDCWVLAVVENDVHRVVYRGQLLRGLVLLPPAPQGVAIRLSWSQQSDAEDDQPQHSTEIALITHDSAMAEAARKAISVTIEARARTQVFGIDLGALALRYQGQPPPIVQQLSDIIVSRGGLQAVGIFRVSVSKAELQRLRSIIDSGCTPDVTDPMTAAALLRLWLRCLPTPLLTYDLYDAWLRAGALTGKEQIERLRELIAQLPTPNRLVTSSLMALLAKIVAESSVNMMTATNIAIVLAPSLLRARQTDLDSVAVALETSRLFRPVEALINNYFTLFVAPVIDDS